MDGQIRLAAAPIHTRRCSRPDHTLAIMRHLALIRLPVMAKAVIRLFQCCVFILVANMLPIVIACGDAPVLLLCWHRSGPRPDELPRVLSSSQWSLRRTTQPPPVGPVQDDPDHARWRITQGTSCLTIWPGGQAGMAPCGAGDIKQIFYFVGPFPFRWGGV